MTLDYIVLPTSSPKGEQEHGLGAYAQVMMTLDDGVSSEMKS